MNSGELKIRFAELWHNGQDDTLIDTVLSLPDSDLNEELIYWASDCYLEIDKYEKSLSVLERLRPRFGNGYFWKLKKAKTLIFMQMSDTDSQTRREILREAEELIATALMIDYSHEAREFANQLSGFITDEYEELSELSRNNHTEDI